MRGESFQLFSSDFKIKYLGYNLENRGIVNITLKPDGNQHRSHNFGLLLPYLNSCQFMLDIC